VLDKKVEKAEIVELDSFGNAQVGRDPTKKDVDLKIKILCYETQNSCFYKQYELVIGESIPINTENSSLWATIINI
jgi:hypothetical protein